MGLFGAIFIPDLQLQLALPGQKHLIELTTTSTLTGGVQTPVANPAQVHYWVHSLQTPP